MALPSAGLWRSLEVSKLWSGRAVSQIGSQISIRALPLLAVLSLGTAPAPMGLIVVAETTPLLLAGHHWPPLILITTDLDRPTLLLVMPLLPEA